MEESNHTYREIQVQKEKSDLVSELERERETESLRESLREYV